MEAMKWFWGFLKKYRMLLGIGLVMTTALAVLAIVNPYVSGMIVDDVITGGQFSLLPKLIAALLLVTLVRGILRFSQQYVYETCSQGVLYDMRDKVYRKLLLEDFSFYSRKKLLRRIWLKNLRFPAARSTGILNPCAWQESRW